MFYSREQMKVFLSQPSCVRMRVYAEHSADNHRRYADRLQGRIYDLEDENLFLKEKISFLETRIAILEKE